MKIFLIVLFLSVTTHATQFVFEPFVNAQYGCNYLEGENSLISLKSTELNEALAESRRILNTVLTINCNRDEYICAHGDGDVEPKPVVLRSIPREYKVLGGRILNATTSLSLVYLNEMGYHQNLRPLPRCRY